MFLMVCKRCGEAVRFPTASALRRALEGVEPARRRLCQGCRAALTFEREPGVAGLVLDFWHRTGRWPQSPAWVEALPLLARQQWWPVIRAAYGDRLAGQGKEELVGGLWLPREPIAAA